MSEGKFVILVKGRKIAGPVSYKEAQEVAREMAVKGMHKSIQVQRCIEAKETGRVA